MINKLKQKSKIYLSGGLDSNWQGEIINEFTDNFVFFNPRDHDLHEAKQYTAWDLYHLRLSDIVFAYMEKNNPSGYGLSLEIGYAAALNKTIILVDEKSEKDAPFKEKFKIVRESTTVVFNNITDGIKYLKSFT